MSLARRHQQRVLAGQVAVVSGAGVTALVAALATAGLAAPDVGPRAVAYTEMLMQLAAHKRQLKAIESIERKIELKRTILPAYAAWVDGVLQAETSGAVFQDEIVTTIMLWRMDAGDYDAALPLADYVLRNKLALPAHIQRKPACLIAEEVADAALSALGRGAPAPYEALTRVADMTEGADMPDEVRCKLHKALGLEFSRIAETDMASQSDVAGAPRAYREYAHRQLTRAYALNPRCGVKKEVDRLARELKKKSSQSSEPGSPD